MLMACAALFLPFLWSGPYFREYNNNNNAQLPACFIAPLLLA
jgi:hypothetical protein